MSDATTRQTDDADTAAVTEVVRTYYDGTMTGDEAKLASAFHPRAWIVGTWEGALDLVTSRLGGCTRSTPDVPGCLGSIIA